MDERSTLHGLIEDQVGLKVLVVEFVMTMRGGSALKACYCRVADPVANDWLTPRPHEDQREGRMRWNAGHRRSEKLVGYLIPLLLLSMRPVEGLIGESGVLHLIKDHELPSPASRMPVRSQEIPPTFI